MRIHLNVNNPDDYQTFLKLKRLPQVQFHGRECWFPDEYADRLGLDLHQAIQAKPYRPIPGLFDYQRDIAALEIRKKKFAIFADCGLGKTLMFFEFARHIRKLLGRKRILIVSPLMVIRQTMQECETWYGKKLPIEKVSAADLPHWTEGESGGQIGITNYEGLTEEVRQGKLGALILDESSMLKSHYGKWGQHCIRLGRGLEWKLAGTGTPAPNDRIEYANHAVFLDAFPTVNSFLARFFVNRGQTNERWELKPHALGGFYRALSHWCIFLTNPATYGWTDNVGKIPPIHVHIHDVDLTEQQRDAVYKQTRTLVVDSLGGITTRAKLSQISKGQHNGQRIHTEKPAFLRRLVDSWPEESTIIWCRFNQEQDRLEETFPEAASIRGETPIGQRERMIDDFKSGKVKKIITKPKILGYGQNLQICTRQVFSSCEDSYEAYYQAVKRSNRVGSTRPLNVHLPVTEVERPMMENVLRKAARVQADTEEQEKLFKDSGMFSVPFPV